MKYIQQLATGISKTKLDNITQYTEVQKKNELALMKLWCMRTSKHKWYLFNLKMFIIKMSIS